MFTVYVGFAKQFHCWELVSEFYILEIMHLLKNITFVFYLDNVDIWNVCKSAYNSICVFFVGFFLILFCLCFVCNFFLS